MKELQTSCKEYAEHAFSEQANAECVGGVGHFSLYTQNIMQDLVGFSSGCWKIGLHQNSS